jgi:DNA-binding transcriptional regulator YdaS (Cro superfamily)
MLQYSYMKTETALAYFGKQVDVAKALGIKRQAVSKWIQSQQRSRW